MAVHHHEMVFVNQTPKQPPFPKGKDNVPLGSFKWSSVSPKQYSASKNSMAGDFIGFVSSGGSHGSLVD